MPAGDSDPLRTISADPSQLDHQHRLSRVSAGRHAAGGRAPITSRAGDRDAAPGWKPDGDRPGAAPVRPRDHLGLCQGRPDRSARCRAVLAGSGAMSALAQRAEQYLRLRRALGHQLDDAHRLLPRFVAFLDSLGASRITVEAALVWVRRPDADPASSVWSRRMTVVRGFARHMSGIDPDTEIPPLGLVTFQRHWRTPFIYSSDDVETLMAAVTRLVPTPLRAATFQTMIGLLAVTGMRVGETIALDRNDIDWAEAVIVVRSSKFNKSRELPLDSSTINALACYAQIRDRCVPRPASPTFFVSARAHRSSTPT